MIIFSDVNSEDSDMKFASTHIPFPSSDVGNTVQGMNSTSKLNSGKHPTLKS